MKTLNQSAIPGLIPVILLSFICMTSPGQSRQKLLMDFGWKFELGEQAGAQQFDYDDSRWRTLDLPHDWSIEGAYDKEAPTGGSGGYLPTGIGWYRRTFQMPQGGHGKNIRIEFDGVYMNSDVWINGHHLGNYPNGYNSFFYELTPYLTNGSNVIAVRVDNSLQPNTRWYSGSGIYRHVWMVITDPVHITRWGIYITTPVIKENKAKIRIRTTLKNDTKRTKTCQLRTIILDKDNREAGGDSLSIDIQAGAEDTVFQEITISQPALWSVDSPYLYKAEQSVVVRSHIVDACETSFGIRTIEYDVDKGFFLNNKHLKMKGVCLHHDGGCVGAAVPEKIWERRLLKLKEMGCNAIRTAHNLPAPEFLDLCDRLGFLVMDECFDEWRIGKREYAYNKYFDHWWKNDLLGMIRRDCNHPSVVLWSAGNEIPEQRSSDGHILLQKMIELIRHEDPTRPVTLGCDNIAADNGSTTKEFLETLDIVGYNYVDRWHERRELFYSIDRHEHPGWKMIGTESVSNGGIRGYYSFGNDSGMIRPNYNFRMIRAEQLWKYVSVHDFVIGDFMWTGIDYLGESWWPGKNASSGVLDLCGFPKDGYYFYQSMWTDEPMIHLLPHWNWKGREGQFIPVICYTNCDAVELFLNGRSVGEKRLEFPRQGTSGGWNKYEKSPVLPTTADLHLSWDIPYEPGIVKAVGKKEGKTVCSQQVVTTGSPCKIRLSADRNFINADATDVAHINFEITDAEGRVVPEAENLVKFAIEGNGRIIGVDNGNPFDHDSYQLLQRKAFHGMGLAIIQSTMRAGKIKITATSANLEGDSVVIEAKQCKMIHVLP
jgi:beta-galactosidase